MAKPFEGLKVLELATVVAAPCTARLFADLGAKVVKIEKNSGDPWRATGISCAPNEFTKEENPVFDLYNSGKQSITLNVKAPEGKEILMKLLSEADIFVTNIRQKALERLGIDYYQIEEKFPRLIYARIEGFGSKGPDKDIPAYDRTAFWARCGMLRDRVVLDDNGEFYPLVPPYSAGDTVNAYLLFGEIATALYVRERTGKGQYVKAGLFHTGVFTFATMAVQAIRPFGEKAPKRRIEYGASEGWFKCKDGEYIFTTRPIVNDARPEMLEELGHGDVYTDERFCTPELRWKNREELFALIKEIFLTKTVAEWEEFFSRHDIAVAKINSFADVCEDEQAIANDYVQDVTFPNGKTLKIPSAPFDMSMLEGEDLRTNPAPYHGQDNADVLRELGYSDAEIQKLNDTGVIKPL